MKDGFLKVCAATPKIKAADPGYNAGVCIDAIKRAAEKGAKVIVLPELVLTGYTCGDLFLQETLLNEAKEQLCRVIIETRDVDALIFIGLPMEVSGKLYNVAAVFSKATVLGFVPKRNIPDYAEFYEQRHFSEGNSEPVSVFFAGQDVPFGGNIIFQCDAVTGLAVGCEICEDLWVPESPSVKLTQAGATVIVNLSASNETVAKASYRRDLVKMSSSKLLCAYIYCSAGDGESTQDLVFSGHDMIAENGVMLAESKRFDTGEIYADIDIKRLIHERRRMSTFRSVLKAEDGFIRTGFDLTTGVTELERKFDRAPFVPSDLSKRAERCEEILLIQSRGLKKRLEHTGIKKAVVGVSGGLDSTLALLVTAKAFDSAGIDRSGIIAVTMPCFGTTGRTKNNAVSLSEALGCTLLTVDIKKAVTVHFEDIGLSPDDRSVTYENGQARERTQVLMDIANKEAALVIGTGDMSELALGWATYNGDHMSMYGVNAGVPKTLVRHLVSWFADTCGDDKLQTVLKDVLDTPVSPELLPPENGEISQKTEDIVGPYELHDFFLYYILRAGFSPDKIYRIALKCFEGIYDGDVILKWLKVFCRRFFGQQFKRSCLPDGPKVGSVAVSPRGDLRMPSDASWSAWEKNILNIKEI
ncbi:MAG: NAD(+) synthase [Lachnospiraceae bacterium]|nr:NAD(+) synthase [Lachnospiraceae bacterium]